MKRKAEARLRFSRVISKQGAAKPRKLSVNYEEEHAAVPFPLRSVTMCVVVSGGERKKRRRVLRLAHQGPSDLRHGCRW